MMFGRLAMWTADAAIHPLSSCTSLNFISPFFFFFELYFIPEMSHAATSALCRSIKLQCELYPSRQIAICLDPYCGLGFALWCLCR